MLRLLGVPPGSMQMGCAAKPAEAVDSEGMLTATHAKVPDATASIIKIAPPLNPLHGDALFCFCHVGGSGDFVGVSGRSGHAD